MGYIRDYLLLIIDISHEYIPLMDTIPLIDTIPFLDTIP
jgi:hypothetical protein